MSLINQMLQDLEQRRTATVAPLGGISAPDSGPISRFAVNKVMLALVVVLALSVAFLAGMQQSKTSVIEVLPVTPSAVTGLDNNVAKESSEVVTAAPVQQQVLTEQNTKESLLGGGQKNIDAEKSVEQQPLQQLKKQYAESVVAQGVEAQIALPAPARQVSLSQQHSAVADEKKYSAQEKVKTKAASSVVAVASHQENDARAAIEAEELQANTESTVAGNELIEKRERPLTNQQHAEQVFRKAVKSLAQGKSVQAQAELDQAIQLSPRHVRARETKAAALMNQGRMSEASASLKEGLLLNPQASPLAKLYARILVEQGGVVEAIQVLERTQPTITVDPEYHALLAALYQQAGQHVQAVSVYQRIVSARPAVAQWWLGLAVSLESLQESAQALNAYQQAWRLGGLSKTVRQYIAQRIESLSATHAVEAKPAKLARGGDQ